MVQRDVSQVLAAIGSAVGASAASILIHLGYRDETKLTNYLFWAEHPDMAGEKIQAGQKELVRDWLRIRNEIVRPKLAAASMFSKAGGTVMEPPAVPPGGPYIDDLSLPLPGHLA